MWTITRDYITKKCADVDVKTQVGIHTQDFDKAKCVHKFRLKDDDGIVYYHGISDSCDDNKAFEPLDYYLTHSGCTSIEYYNSQLHRWEIL